MLYAFGSVSVLGDNMNIYIRFAKKVDIDNVLMLDKHISKEELNHSIERSRVLIIEENNRFIGFLRYNLFWDNTPFMNLIYIIESHQGNGYGTKLVLYWENLMKELGYRNVLTSTLSNEEAQYFYKKLGYKDIGGFTLDNDPYEIIFEKILK